MNQKILQKILRELSQEQLLPLILAWSPTDQEKALKELTSIDPEILLEQRRLISEKDAFSTSIVPPRQVNYVEMLSEFDREKGVELVQAGKVACILVAGGQGTRLNVSIPKGCVPVTAVRHKTLFQLFAEKVHAASCLFNRPLEMAIMTSPINHEETVAFFQKQHFFGCRPAQISFFSQGMLPFLTSQGDLIFEDQGKLALGPDGNGAAILAFQQAGILENWRQKGIEYVNFVLIDNPLTDPFDPILVGAHSEKGVQVTLKCIERLKSEERFGLVVEKDGKTQVIEYSEIPQEAWGAKNSSGQLSFYVANISLYCFSLDFLERVAATQLPLHKAYKALALSSHKSYGWKFERFIFDILPFATATNILIYPRDVCFAPLKNSNGEYNIESVQKALTAADRKNLQHITGIPTPSTCFETDVAFHYPTPQILAKWHGKTPPPTPYVEV